MEGLIVLALLALIAWFWADSLKARELALARARVMCESVGVQFLDETVSLRHIKPRRDEDGRVKLERGYRFEFSLNGSDRHQGVAVLIGGIVERIQLDHPQGSIVTPADNVVPLRRPR